MTVRLTVERTRWFDHVDSTLQRVRNVAEPVPVVKGNGYGFGRQQLLDIAATRASVVCVGSVHEIDGVPDALDVVVLTPSLSGPDERAILTIGSAEHISPIKRSAQRVIVKLQSSMNRYGGAATLVDEARAAGLVVDGVALHLPLEGSEDERVTEVTQRLNGVPTDVDVWLSHIEPESISLLPTEYSYRLRLGTLLWHGSRTSMHLEADVLDLRQLSGGDRAGYRRTPIERDCTVALIGAGTANGVHPLADGRSPFHYQQQRLDLVEPPHMHTSMVLIPSGNPVPDVGTFIDLQRPLTTTAVDEIVWAD